MDLKDFKKYCVTRLHYSQSTVEDRCRKLRHMLKMGVDIGDPESCYDFFAEKIMQRSRTTALNHYIKSLNAYHKYIKSEHHFDPYKENYKPVKIPTTEEVRSVLKTFNRSWKGKTLKTMTFLIANSGMRISEICNLKLDDIDWYRNCINVVGKGDKPRTIPLKSYVMVGKKYPSILNYINHHRKKTSKDRVFTWINGPFNPPMFRKYFKDVVRRAGVGWLHPHSLRHYYATMLLKHGVNVKIVQLVLGHSDIKTTSRYLHMLDNDIFSAIQKTTFDDLLFSLTYLYGENPYGPEEIHNFFILDSCQGGSFFVSA